MRMKVFTVKSISPYGHQLHNPAVCLGEQNRRDISLLESSPAFSVPHMRVIPSGPTHPRAAALNKWRLHTPSPALSWYERKSLLLCRLVSNKHLFLHGSSLLKARVERRNKPILECLNQKSVIFFSISKSSSVWVTNILVDHHNISTVWWSIPSAHHSMEICF